MANLSRKIQTFSDGSVQVSTPPPAPVSKLRRLLTSVEWTSDHQARQNSIDFCMGHMKDCGSRVGLPDQMAQYYDEFIPLSKKLQFFWFDLCCLSLYGRLHDQLLPLQLRTAKETHLSFTDSACCFNNGVSWQDGYQDFVHGIHKDLTKGPIQYENVFLSNNQVEVISDSVVVMNANYLKQGPRNYEHLQVRCLNLSQLDRRLPPVSEPPEVRLPFVLEVFEDVAVCHRKLTTMRPDRTTGLFPQWAERGVYLLARWKSNTTLIRRDLIEAR